MIEVQHLTKYYGRHPGILDVSFGAEKGEILGFLGPNGAGKTTAMRILTCYLPPSSGMAKVAGYDVLDQSLEVRRRIGYLPENVPLYHDLSVSGYLGFVARLKGMQGRSRRARIEKVVEECGLAEVRNRIIGKLSKGYRQRVGLAQALVNDPDVLILDEPTVGLDPRQIIEIRELIRNLAGRRTVILSTHILPEASLLCNRVIIINKGKLVTVDTPDNLKNRLQRGMTVEITVRGDREAIRGVLETVTGVSSVTDTSAPSAGTCAFRVEAREGFDVREPAAQAVVTNGFGLLELAPVDMSLEDIFVELVTQEDIN
ncbi:MAG: ATP-binding cassette domain-containing protein [Candidatus Latescibacterota bacterium]|nr:MAG: ATP-binding cassette domain-containing protein [Candidatus Latescibacterota bacterium]